MKLNFGLSEQFIIKIDNISISETKKIKIFKNPLKNQR